jgi:ferredoxin-NADP reductase
MIAMYFFKMRRAALLLQNLTGATTPSAAARPVSGSVAQAQPPSITAAASTRAPSKKWSGQLRVGRIFQETPDVKTFRLMNPIGGVLPFEYLPGQFITVAVPVSGGGGAGSDGKTGGVARRSYTIASSPTHHDFAEITVKHAPAPAAGIAPGIVSGYLHSQVREGDLLEFSGPAGSFIFTGRECKCILLIAGGVGITPLMSVLRYLLDRSWTGEIFLIYGCRTPQDIIFREELEYLQRRHPKCPTLHRATSTSAARCR